MEHVANVGIPVCEEEGEIREDDRTIQLCINHSSSSLQEGNCTNHKDNNMKRMKRMKRMIQIQFKFNSNSIQSSVNSK